MLSFVLGVLLTSSLILIFRTFPTFRINTFQAVVVNYCVCVLTGWITFGNYRQFFQLDFTETWVWQSMMLGALFISTFYLMAITTHQAGVTVTTVVNKISLVIPVAFSLFIFKTSTKLFDWINYSGLLLALGAIILSSIKKESPQSFQKIGILSLLLPFVVFVMSGLVDLTSSYLSWRFVTPERFEIFPILAFSGAASIGLVILLGQMIFLRKFPDFRSMVGGVSLGIPNFFSFYYMILALQYFQNNGSLMFPIFNISVILVSTAVAWSVFKEKLTTINQLGMLMAVLAIIAVAYQEIYIYFKF
jgi:multidrug transporter EmrE-like cation transporter